MSVWPKNGVNGHRDSGTGLGRGENKGEREKYDLKRSREGPEGVCSIAQQGALDRTHAEACLVRWCARAYKSIWWECAQAYSKVHSIELVQVCGCKCWVSTLKPT